MRMNIYKLLPVIIIAGFLPVGVYAQSTQPTLSQIVSKRVTAIKTGGYNGTASVDIRGLDSGKSYSARVYATFDGTVYSKNNGSIDGAEGTYSLSFFPDNTIQQTYGVSNESVTLQVKSILEGIGKYRSYLRIMSASPAIQTMLNQYQQLLGTKVTILSSWLKLPQAPYKQSSYQTKFTASEQALILQKFVNALDIVSDKGVVPVNEFNGRHFILSLTPEKLKQFIIEVTPIISKQPISQNDLNELNKFIADPVTRDFLSKTKINAWLGESDGKIYKLTIQTSEIAVASGKNPMYIGYTLDINLKNIPATYKIVKPKKSIDIDVLMKKASKDRAALYTPKKPTTPVSSTASSAARDAAAKATVMQLIPKAVLYWEQNATYVGFCESKTVWDAKLNLGNNSQMAFYCRGDKNNAQIYSKISTGYFCADTAGGSATVSSSPAAQTSLFCK